MSLSQKVMSRVWLSALAENGSIEAKEPTFESDFDIPVLTIPMHGSKTLKRRTQKEHIHPTGGPIAWEQKFDYDQIGMRRLWKSRGRSAVSPGE